MKISLSYLDLLIRTLGLARHEISVNHTCVFWYHDPCTQIDK